MISVSCRYRKYVLIFFLSFVVFIVLIEIKLKYQIKTMNLNSQNTEW